MVEPVSRKASVVVGCACRPAHRRAAGRIQPSPNAADSTRSARCRIRRERLPLEESLAARIADCKRVASNRRRQQGRRRSRRRKHPRKRTLCGPGSNRPRPASPDRGGRRARRSACIRQGRERLRPTSTRSAWPHRRGANAIATEVERHRPCVSDRAVRVGASNNPTPRPTAAAPARCTPDVCSRTPRRKEDTRETITEKILRPPVAAALRAGNDDRGSARIRATAASTATYRPASRAGNTTPVSRDRTASESVQRDVAKRRCRRNPVRAPSRRRTTAQPTPRPKRRRSTTHASLRGRSAAPIVCGGTRGLGSIPAPPDPSSAIPSRKLRRTTTTNAIVEGDHLSAPHVPPLTPPSPRDRAGCPCSTCAGDRRSRPTNTAPVRRTDRRVRRPPDDPRDRSTAPSERRQVPASVVPPSRERQTWSNCPQPTNTTTAACRDTVRRAKPALATGSRRASAAESRRSAVLAAPTTAHSDGERREPRRPTIPKREQEASGERRPPVVASFSTGG